MRTRPIPALVACLVAALLAGAAQDARAVIDLKVSVKWVRSADGAVGPGSLSTQLATGTFVPCDEVVTEQDFLDRIEYANRILALSGRGYRFVVEFATVTPPALASPDACGDRGTPGRANGVAGATTCATVTPPAVVINEIMVNPALWTDEDGEWFELVNTTAAPISLQNWTVRDNGSNQFTITTPLTIPANGFVVLGRRGDFYANGNVAVNFAYGQTFFLNNTQADAIVLRNASGVEVDRVEYTPAWITEGASLALKATTRDNNCQDAWAVSPLSYWSQWTSLGGNCRGSIEAAAMADTVTWKWDPDALNVYMGSPCTGGASGTTRFSHITAAIGQTEAGGFVRPFHELGHSLGICHTHDCFDWNPRPCFCQTSTISDDCLADTPLDNPSWGNGRTAGQRADTLAVLNFGMPYDQLPCDQKQDVLDVTYNFMSYHRDDDYGYPNSGSALICDADQIAEIPCGTLAASLPEWCRHRMSPRQLDRLGDFANNLLRRARDLGNPGRFASGLTHVVDAQAAACPAGPSWCQGEDADWECVAGNSVRPHATVSAALTAIAGEHEPGMDHIILLRPGTYNEPLTITRRVDLRGSGGASVIGRP